MSMAEQVHRALKMIEYPNKEALWQHVQRLGKQHQRMFPSYKFVPRGGLSSPHVAYVTDVDLIFNNPEHGHVVMKDLESLQKLTEQLCGGRAGLLSAKVTRGKEDLFDGSVEDMGAVWKCVSTGADVVIMTGMYRLSSGWCVPMDITLQRGESKMTKEERMERIWQNLEVQNYAKVVQRMRAMLKPEPKAAFAKAWNTSGGGALRFLVKQLELVAALPPREREDYLYYLCLPSEPSHEQWAEVAEAEMQRVALDVLLSTSGLTRGVLGKDAEAFQARLKEAQLVQSAEAVGP